MSLVEISRDPNSFLLRSEYFCVPRRCPPNYGAIWTEDDVRVRNVSYLYWAIVKSIFTETHFFLESFIRGVSNTPLNGVRLDGFLNITVGGPRKFIADRLDHADSFHVLTKIDVCHPLAYIHFENNFLALWVGYNPVSLCVGVYNVP